MTSTEFPIEKKQDLEKFVRTFCAVPCFSGAVEDATLRLEIRVNFLHGTTHEVRLFPMFTETTVDDIKKKFTEEVEAMVHAEGLEAVKSLPMSIEDMSKKTAFTMNPFTVWRMEKLTTSHASVEGYTLAALRHMADPLTKVPCVVASYAKEGDHDIDVFFMTLPISPLFETILRGVQTANDEKLANTASSENTGGNGVGGESPLIVTPGLVS